MLVWWITIKTSSRVDLFRHFNEQIVKKKNIRHTCNLPWRDREDGVIDINTEWDTIKTTMNDKSTLEK